MSTYPREKLGRVPEEFVLAITPTLSESFMPPGGDLFPKLHPSTYKKSYQAPPLNSNTKSQQSPTSPSKTQPFHTHLLPNPPHPASEKNYTAFVWVAGAGFNQEADIWEDDHLRSMWDDMNKKSCSGLWRLCWVEVWIMQVCV